MLGLGKLGNKITLWELNSKSVYHRLAQIHAKLAYRDRTALRPQTRLQYKRLSIFKEIIFLSKRRVVRNGNRKKQFREDNNWRQVKLYCGGSHSLTLLSDHICSESYLLGNLLISRVIFLRKPLCQRISVLSIWQISQSITIGITINSSVACITQISIYR